MYLLRPQVAVSLAYLSDSPSPERGEEAKKGGNFAMGPAISTSYSRQLINVTVDCDCGDDFGIGLAANRIDLNEFLSFCMNIS